MVTETSAPAGAGKSSPRRAEGMAGLAKGLAILELFGAGTERLTVADAARGADLSPASARRCLLTLEAIGYLHHDGKYFRPTPRLVRLGASYFETSEFSALAAPRVAAARDALDESVSVAVRDDDVVVFVARAEVRRIVSAGVRLGARLPMAASASGRVLLAALHDDAVRKLVEETKLVRTTERTLVKPEQILSRITQARTDGYSITDEELEVGMRTMAVPVIDSTGATRAAMSVSAFTSRVTLDDLVDRFLPVLRAEATLLGRGL